MLRDCDRYYQWVNDDEVIRNSFENNGICYEEHILWFENKLNDISTSLFVAIDTKGIPVGQIRIYFEDNSGLISFSIDKMYRGLGYGSKMIELIEKKIQNEMKDTNTLIGRVKYDNKASCHIFEKNGYKRTNKKSFVEYTKKFN